MVVELLLCPAMTKGATERSGCLNRVCGVMNYPKYNLTTWVFPKIWVPQNGWFIMEKLVEMDDFGGTHIFGNPHMSRGIEFTYSF